MPSALVSKLLEERCLFETITKILAPSPEAYYSQEPGPSGNCFKLCNYLRNKYGGTLQLARTGGRLATHCVLRIGSLLVDPSCFLIYDLATDTTHGCVGHISARQTGPSRLKITRFTEDEARFPLYVVLEDCTPAEIADMMYYTATAEHITSRFIFLRWISDNMLYTIKRDTLSIMTDQEEVSRPLPPEELIECCVRLGFEEDEVRQAVTVCANYHDDLTVIV